MSSNTEYTVSAVIDIDAPPAIVYGIIADYRDGHPHILPRQFTRLDVERGGVGAGTVIRFGMRVLGRTFPLRAEITEPEPGRVLVESNVGDRPSVTTWYVDARPGGRGSRVTLTTVLPGSRGLAGALERWMTTRFLLKVFADELALLSARASAAAAPAPGRGAASARAGETTDRGRRAS